MTLMLVWVARPSLRRAWFDGFPRPSQTQGVPPSIGKDVTLIVVKLNHAQITRETN